MVSAGLVRKNAAAILKNILPQSIAIAGIFFLFWLLGIYLGQTISLLCPVPVRAGIAQLVSVLCDVFFSVPLMMGIQRWTWRLTGGADDSLRTVFYAFGDKQNYRRAFGYSLRYTLCLYVPRLTALPRIFLEHGEDAALHPLSVLHGGFTGLFSAVAAVLELAGLFLSLWLALRFFLAPYLLANDDSLSPAQALRLSFQVMHKRTGRLLGFFFSFIGWGLLCVLILPVMYVFPLFWISTGIYARYLIADYNSLHVKGGGFFHA